MNDAGLVEGSMISASRSPPAKAADIGIVNHRGGGSTHRLPRLRLFGIADHAGFVNVLAGKAEVRKRRLIVPARNIYWLPRRGDFAPLLRRVVLCVGRWLTGSA